VTKIGIKRKIAFFLINRFFCGVKPCYWKIKRNLLNWAGFEVGKGTKIVGPNRIYGNLVIGENTWVGTGLTVHGNGSVIIGDNCDIAPDVTFLTGSHVSGDVERRAGHGCKFIITIKNGTWIGARSTFVGNIEIGKACIVGASALVNKSYKDNILIGGIPSKVIKELNC
jgi:maltose O-acetyltransferase